MELAFLAFTDKGFQLAQKLAESLGGSVMRCGQPDSLKEWTAREFARADGLVFVGAVGIAVRAIAPHLDKKWKDPAVVVVDETARFAISLVSGHLGGANRLTRMIASRCGAQPVITTATDVNGVFGVDDWAREQGLWIPDPQHIRLISSKLLAGGTIRLYSRWPISGRCPEGVELVSDLPADVAVSFRGEEEATLSLVAPAVVLGIGCRKGTPAEKLEQVLQDFLTEAGLDGRAVCGVASIDLKKEEPGLLTFCQAHNWSFVTYTAQELAQVSGNFSPSDFVKQVTGVDNVCERSAVAAVGGALLYSKFAKEGVTMAAALKAPVLTWNQGISPETEA